jgi:arsenical pump membrane protein
VAAGLGCAGAVIAALARPDEARSAAAQDWPPFVLVSGLLLVGLVANQDGLFAAAGHWLARVARNGIALYVGAVLLVATVTTVLNLDTSVAFLTPILVYTARSRGEGEAPLLYGCILLANAGSLLLPGSNLTNLIVLGQVHLSGGHFFREMAPAGVAAIVVTAAVVGIAHHKSLRTTAMVTGRAERPTLGAGLIAIVAATIFVLLFSSPAVPVAAIGVAAVLTVLVNNLPAASLLASRPPPRPFALLIGLNIGPNLFVSGSLAWALWWKAARTAQARPSVSRATRLGLVTAPLAMAAALAMLTLSGLK